MTRFKEHLQSFLYNDFKTKFAHHLLENGLPMGTSHYIMYILHVTTNFPHLENLKELYVYKKTTNSKQMNNKHISSPSEIHDVVTRHPLIAVYCVWFDTSLTKKSERWPSNSKECYVRFVYLYASSRVTFNHVNCLKLIYSLHKFLNDFYFVHVQHLLTVNWKRQDKKYK